MADPTPLFNDERRPRGGNGNGEPPITEMEVEKRLTAVESIIPTLATKTDFADLRADLHKMDASIKTWMIATIIGLFFGFAGLFFAMSSSLKPAATVSAQAPIIINVPSPIATAAPALSPQK